MTGWWALTGNGSDVFGIETPRPDAPGLVGHSVLQPLAVSVGFGDAIVTVNVLTALDAILYRRDVIVTNAVVDGSQYAMATLLAFGSSAPGTLGIGRAPESFYNEGGSSGNYKGTTTTGKGA